MKKYYIESRRKEKLYVQQDKQCTYNVTLWRVRATILHWKCNNTFCVHCSATCHRRIYKNIECCTTVLLWQIYVPNVNANHAYPFLKEIIFQLICTHFTIHTLHINAALKQQNVRLFLDFCRRTVSQ